MPDEAPLVPNNQPLPIDYSILASVPIPENWLGTRNLLTSMNISDPVILLSESVPAELRDSARELYLRAHHFGFTPPFTGCM